MTKDDFMLIVATNDQLEMLKDCAPKTSFISCDATHGTNAYDYKLITVLVEDETGHGVTVAHCICNKEDTACLTIFFKELLDLAGPLKISYFLSDDAPAVSRIIVSNFLIVIAYKALLKYPY